MPIYQQLHRSIPERRRAGIASRFTGISIGSAGMLRSDFVAPRSCSQISCGSGIRVDRSAGDVYIQGTSTSSWFAQGLDLTEGLRGSYPETELAMNGASLARASLCFVLGWE